MPSPNSRKTYVENGYYHIYNRGVEKRIIFQDEQDYHVFLKYLKESLTIPPPNKKIVRTIKIREKTFDVSSRLPKNYTGLINLLAYCLMPNHFHLLIHQRDKDTMNKFIQSLITRYSMYFNKKYKRVGSLFQGRYKAVMITNDTYLLHLSRYIHLNPSEFTENLTGAYSSYANYLGLKKTEWLNPEKVLTFFNKDVSKDFKKNVSYKGFVESYNKNSSKLLGKLILEEIE